MMRSAAKISKDSAPEYAYHLLRGALQSFQKAVCDLNEVQFEKAKAVADKTFSLESRVLSAPEARDVIVPESRLTEALTELESRYTDHAAFIADLERNGLDTEILQRALHRELLFDAVMQSIVTDVPQVSDIDIEIFYELHKDQFSKPEKRKVRHILVTINPEYSENTREAAFARINEVNEKLKSSPTRFDKTARKYSECPTAMDGGLLGEVNTGVLYPELDTVLFNMSEGEVSGIIESEMGFHILLCEKISKSITLPLSRARDRIRQVLQERQRIAFQKTWLENIQEKTNG